MQYALLSTLLVSLADCRIILSSEASIGEEVARYDLEVDADYPTELVEQAVNKAELLEGAAGVGGEEEGEEVGGGGAEVGGVQREAVQGRHQDLSAEDRS